MSVLTRLVPGGVRLGGRVARIVPLVVVLAAPACVSGAEDSEGAERDNGEPTRRVESGPRRLVYATRSDGHVTVFRRPLGPGEAEGLFTYQESDGRPDVAVSPDGRLVAYVVGGVRLHVRDLASGEDTILVEGEEREVPPMADAAAPRWSKDGMNFLTPQPQEDCPECGILGIGRPVFSPSGRWVAFEQGYYEGANWGFVERATGRYETSGDLAGSLHWRSDSDAVGVGAFYGEDASVRTADVDMLPETREVPMGDYGHFGGALSPAGDDIALIATAGNATAAPDNAALLVRSTLAGGPGAVVDQDGRKLTVGFTGDGTLLWVERRGLAADLLREGAAPTPLPDDLYRYDDMIPAGPRLVGMTGHTRPACNQVAEPCHGPAPPYQQRFLLIDADAGIVAWQSPAIGEDASFGGMY